ncbi:sensor domain-containing diguanylate cyclase [Luteimonas vadosa]|uniref:diguanylate cyclase n=1 Tax=Luteimonas vadosa TaxID=1165507 RepID=A0ABP9DY42_9GAMM
MSGALAGPWSLQRAFARLLLIAALLPALAFGAATLVSDYLAERRELTERLETSTRLTAANIDSFLDNQLAGVALLADARSVRAEDWDTDLARLMERFPSLLTALVTDADAEVIAARTREGPARIVLGNVADREYFRVPSRTLQPHVSHAFRGRGMGSDALIAVSAPLRRGGRFDGVVEGSILVDSFTHSLNDAFVERGYERVLLDGEGRVVSATPGMGVDFLDRVDVARRFAPAPDGGVVFRRDVLADGGSGFVATANMHHGWSQVVVLRQPPLLQAVTPRVLMLTGVLLLVTLGVVVAVWWQMKQLSRGTGDLLVTLERFALGTRTEPVRDDSKVPVELQPLAKAIDDLAARLNAAYADLNESLETQRGLAGSLRTEVTSREQQIAAQTEQLRNAVAELDRRTRTDALTGCLNVRGLDHWLSALWPGLGEAGWPLALLAMDIDAFKAFNDRYGHPAGDVALKRVVGAARGAIRGEHDAIARIGGEEFLVLLPGAGHDRATEVAERIREAVQAAGIPHEDAPGGRLTVSVGIAIHGRDGDAPSVQAAIERADQALYRAKAAGRNQVAD